MLVYLVIEFALLISNEKNHRFHALIFNAKSKSRAIEGWLRFPLWHAPNQQKQGTS
jgi:hypothetical protein